MCELEAGNALIRMSDERHGVAVCIISLGKQIHFYCLNGPAAPSGES